ncbi:glycosyltransferase [Ruminococcus sp. AF17-11]|jgi:glycosyltransferase involved in cell wall biosynthesis|nr:glycosyltransferase [Ruminococcus sp. AF17-11]RGG88473.1 glycosyltransferase [Ruminococcus sp. AF17-11]
MDCTISVIVPVYNSEKYLKRCIDSILNQTYKAIELILVDDGSPDNCGKICDEYAKKDKRVRVIHKTNAGVSAARNSGLEIASGNYATFVDSDDYIEPEMYGNMMEKVHQYNCDVVMCDCIKDFTDHSEIYTHDIRAGFYDKEQLVNEYYPHLLMMENVEYPATISNWLILFNRNKLGNLRYVVGVRYSEDLLFGAQLVYNTDSFYYMKEQAYYHYYMNPTSATHKFTVDKWNDYKTLHFEINKYFSECESFDFSHQIDLCLLFFVYNSVSNIFSADNLEREKKFEIVKNILGDNEVRRMFSNIKVLKLPISKKLKIVTIIYKYRIGLSFWYRYS